MKISPPQETPRCVPNTQFIGFLTLVWFPEGEHKHQFLPSNHRAEIVTALDLILLLRSHKESSDVNYLCGSTTIYIFPSLSAGNKMGSC